MANKRIFCVTGLGFGDESKGASVDALCWMYPDIDLVVKSNGGGNSAHNVVLPNGLHHTFSQWGAGSFVGRVRTLLSRFMLVNPSTLVAEAQHLGEIGVPIAGRMFIDERCLVTTTFHMLLNRAREQSRGIAHHGTTGMGISETVMDHMAYPHDVLTIGDLRDKSADVIEMYLQTVAERLLPELLRCGGMLEFERVNLAQLAKVYWEFMQNVTVLTGTGVYRMMQDSKGIVIEGAQGVLLDQYCGFHPHTTWSSTTDRNPLTLINENGLENEQVEFLGITRTYHTRHGAGPFPTESASDEYHIDTQEIHNGDHGAAGQFRTGPLDFSLLTYALRCCVGPMRLVVSHCDVETPHCLIGSPMMDDIHAADTLPAQEGVTRRAFEPAPMHRYSHMPYHGKAEFIAEELGLPLFMKAFGPTWKDRALITKGKAIT